LWKAGKDAVAVVQAAGDKSCNKLRHHIVNISLDLFKSSELVKAAGSDFCYVLLKCQFLINKHSQITHYASWLNDVITDLECKVS